MQIQGSLRPREVAKDSDTAVFRGQVVKAGPALQSYPQALHSVNIEGHSSTQPT